ncbi:MAG TPA: hypothetical protein VML96_02560 [Egibacteraceae bacterium]|nr:hypothetical protein [Egibacteraceae bacterium]
MGGWRIMAGVGDEMSERLAGKDPAAGVRSPSDSLKFRGLAVAISGVVAAIAVASDAWADVVARPLEVLFWIAFVSAGGLLTIRVLPRQRVDVSLNAPVAVASALVLGPAVALFVNVLALTSQRELRRGVSGWARLFNHAQAGLSTWTAAVAAGAILDRGPGWLLGAAIVAALTDRVVNVLLAGLGLAALSRLTPRDAAVRSAEPLPSFTIDFGVVMLLGALFAVVYEAVGFLAPMVLALPMWLAYRLLRQLRQTADRAEALAARVRDLEVLERLNQELHSARYEEHACRITADVLGEALGGVIECDPNGEISDGLNAVPVPDSGGRAGSRSGRF